MSSAARRRISSRSLPAEPEPRRLRAARGRDRVLDVLCACPCANVPTRMSLSIGERTSNVAVAVALRAVDDVAVDLAQPRLRPLEPRLVLRVELLVVGAQGRVGDLDPLGGHSAGLSRAGASRGRAARVEARSCGPLYSAALGRRGHEAHRTPGAFRRAPGWRHPPPMHRLRRALAPALARGCAPRPPPPPAPRRRPSTRRATRASTRYAEMVADVAAVAAAHPSIVRTFSIGDSVQGPRRSGPPR